MHYVKKIVLISSGSISLLVGIVGIFLPLIPTTPLLLLAAACYIRSSERLYHWLITNKHFGPYIRNYREGKGIPLKAKVIGVTCLWVSMLFTIVIVLTYLWLKLLLILIAVYFTRFILKQKTWDKNVVSKPLAEQTYK
ncbi:YbaN family protein [Ornithinibacillus salinisoli]|uniref:YbaN family protein n=1 Tax=Ornithinibacillus salinisoli TaxID=1848459 RepID=A0ABW4W0C3_9BACI